MAQHANPWVDGGQGLDDGTLHHIVVASLTLHAAAAVHGVGTSTHKYL
jgi:hypothetical protein